MKLIYNKYFPFGSFYAANIFGLIFCRSDKGRLDEVEKNHEYDGHDFLNEFRQFV